MLKAIPASIFSVGWLRPRRGDTAAQLLLLPRWASFIPQVLMESISKELPAQFPETPTWNSYLETDVCVCARARVRVHTCACLLGMGDRVEDPRRPVCTQWAAGSLFKVCLLSNSFLTTTRLSRGMCL